MQRHVLYLGRLTPAQELSWQKTAEQFGDESPPGQALPGLATERELQSQQADPQIRYLVGTPKGR